MSTNSLTNIDWSSPETIGIVVVVAVIIAGAGYLLWAWNTKTGPFGN